MKAMPLVSVVLPVYNSEKYIYDSIQSILRQTYKNIELIVIDDASTDNTFSKISRFNDPKLKVIRLTMNYGYPNAVNSALDLASGKYIARMDADDVAHPERIARQVAFHESNPEVALVSCLRYWLTPNGKPYTLRSFAKRYSNPVFYESWSDIIERKKVFTDPGALILKQRIIDVGGYRSYQRSGMDIDLWLRLMEYTNAPAAVLSEPLYGKRLIPSAIIFDESTVWKNEVPRRLALERVQKGIDRIKEGKALDDLYEDVKSGKTGVDFIENNKRFLLSCAAQCVLAGDPKGACAFIYACRKGKNSVVANSKTYLMFLKKIASYLCSNEIIRVRSGDCGITHPAIEDG